MTSDQVWVLVKYTFFYQLSFEYSLFYFQEEALIPVFENGKILREFTFEEVRANAEKTTKNVLIKPV